MTYINFVVKKMCLINIEIIWNFKTTIFEKRQKKFEQINLQTTSALMNPKFTVASNKAYNNNNQSEFVCSLRLFISKND